MVIAKRGEHALERGDELGTRSRADGAAAPGVARLAPGGVAAIEVGVILVDRAPQRVEILALLPGRQRGRAGSRRGECQQREQVPPGMSIPAAQGATRRLSR
jgi:hypothetical protein